jgi:solute carrier family 25 phosphate transporter 3
MAKFVVFEKTVEAAYTQIDKNSLSSGAQTAVNLGSGLVAGFAAAIVSQPADTMLSKINKTKGAPGEGTTSRLIKIAKDLGVKGSFAGLPARLFVSIPLHAILLMGLNSNSNAFRRWSVP